MPQCPMCHKQFRTLEDEEYIHECPKCGYFPEEEDEDDELSKLQ